MVFAVLPGSAAAVAATTAPQTNDVPRQPPPPILNESLAGRDSFGPELAAVLKERLAAGHVDPATTRLAARTGDRSALARALAVAADADAAEADRIALIDLLGERAESASLALLLSLATGPASDAIRSGSYKLRPSIRRGLRTRFRTRSKSGLR